MRILVVDDHPLTCQGLAALLASVQAGTQVQCAYSAAQAQELLASGAELPDWLFLDLRLPDDTEGRWFADMLGHPLMARTVLISAEFDDAKVHAALVAGARGFIPKAAQPEVVLEGFARVLEGAFFMPPQYAQRMQAHARDLQCQRALSPRLAQVRELLLAGHSNKLIARELQLSAHTVKEYVSSVFAYHGVNSRLELLLQSSQGGRAL